MIRWMASALLVLIVCAVSTGTQQHDPNQAAPELKPTKDPIKQDKPSTLEELIAQALKNNPDIRVAEAKVREAEAEANRTRLLVTQKVVAIRSAIEVQKAVLGQAERRFQTQKLHEGIRGATSKEEHIDSEQQLAQAKGKLSELEAELAFLTGKSPQTKAAAAVDPTVFQNDQWLNLARPSRNLTIDWSPNFPSTFDFARSTLIHPHVSTTPSGSTMDKLRKALETQVEVKFESAALRDVLDFLEQAAPGLSFRILDSGDMSREVSLKLRGTVPVGAVLQALEDTFSEGSELCFVVRDYGILVTWAHRIPPGALRVDTFWKAKEGDKAIEGDGSKKDPSATEKPK